MTGIIYLYQMKAVHTKLFKVNAVRRAQHVTHTFIFGNCFTPTISVRQQCHIKEPLAVGAVMLTPACSADTLILYHIFCPCRYPRQGTFFTSDYTKCNGTYALQHFNFLTIEHC